MIRACNAPATRRRQRRKVTSERQPSGFLPLDGKGARVTFGPS